MIVKDKLDIIKETNNLQHSRQEAENIVGYIVSGLCDHNMIEAGFKMYEIMDEIYRISGTGPIIYDIDMIVEITLRLRAKRLELEQSITRNQEKSFDIV